MSKSSRILFSGFFFHRKSFYYTVCVVLMIFGFQHSQVISAENPAGKTAKKSREAWRLFDPRAEDLEIEVVKEKIEDGIKVTYLYYTSHKIDSKPVRVYGIYARPEKVERKIPAILFIHGGGQTADEKEAIAMARQGYAVFSHDWKKPKPLKKKHYPTKWPLGENGKVLKGDKYLDSPGWLARRAISFLEKQSEVDPARIGVYGFSWGGFNTWVVNGTDSRVKVASPSCGMIWKPVPYMENLACPVFFTNATNDFFARLDKAEKNMESVKVEHRRLTAPNENHNMAGTGWEATRLKWFNHYLKGEAPLPRSPKINSKMENGKIVVSVNAPSAESSTLVYSYGAAPSTDRCWLGKTMRKTSDGIFNTEIARVSGLKLWYYANCDYSDGTTLSSKCTFWELPSNGPKTKMDKSTILYDPAADGIFPWYFSWNGPVDDNVWHAWHSWAGTGLAVGDVSGKPALYVKWGREFKVTSGLFKAFLRSPACPLRKSDKAGKLKLYVVGARPITIKVAAYATGIWTGDKNPFIADVLLSTGKGWEALEIPLQSFKRENKKTNKQESLSSFDKVKQFHITVESADKTGNFPAIGIIKWLP